MNHKEESHWIVLCIVIIFFLEWSINDAHVTAYTRVETANHAMKGNQGNEALYIGFTQRREQRLFVLGFAERKSFTVK